MIAEEVVKVEWDQLPQRAIWSSLQPSRSNNDHQQQTRSLAPQGGPRKAQVPAGKQPGAWEYLDHTADVQIHSWGTTLNQAFGSCIVGMFAYMVEIDEIDNDLEMDFVADAHDLHSLLFNTLDQSLYLFHTESFVVKQILFKTLDIDNFRVSAVVRGGLFDATRHSQGTEVKAITYSNMQIVQNENGNVDTYVIVDI